MVDRTSPYRGYSFAKLSFLGRKHENLGRNQHHAARKKAKRAINETRRHKP